MIDRDKEYKKAFNMIKKWSKHWLTPSASRRYNAADTLKDPAKKTLEFITNLDHSTSFEDKVHLLCGFLKEMNKEDERLRIYSGFYRDNLSYLNKAIDTIQRGEPIEIYNIYR
ncbi:hypothetical protein KM901_08270 [Bacillus paralicheniformis]|uniref:hypothetical protein n=1 Tax=Bacillus paralicheniformis TaxID=1648923 RepID=UPI001C234F2E|nr:hypothetical protein [Bacillus paralicheniformis]MBU8759302.1 hypothetical protein [Bacillus paralicheniformis]